MARPALHPGHVLLYSSTEALQVLYAQDEAVSDALAVSSWHDRRYYIGAVAPKGATIDAIILMRRGARLRTTTDKYRVHFDHTVQFAQPITLEELAGKRMRAFFKRAASAPLNRLAPEAWQKLLTIIKELRPDEVQRIEGLEALLDAPIPIAEGRTSAAWRAAALERDGLHMAFQLSAFALSGLPEFSLISRPMSLRRW